MDLVGLDWIGMDWIGLDNRSFTPLIFSTIAKISSPAQKIIATKTTTFSESPGRQLSYGISGYLLKIFASGRDVFAFA